MALVPQYSSTKENRQSEWRSANTGNLNFIYLFTVEIVCYQILETDGQWFRSDAIITLLPWIYAGLPAQMDIGKNQ